MRLEYRGMGLGMGRGKGKSTLKKTTFIIIIFIIIISSARWSFILANNKQKALETLKGIWEPGVVGGGVGRQNSKVDIEGLTQVWILVSDT